MPNQIDDNKIFSSNFLERTLEKFRELLKLIRGVEAEMKDVLKVQAELLKNSDKKSISGLEKRKKAITSINQVSKEMLSLEKQRKRVSSQLQIAETQQAKALAKSKIELRGKRKAVNDQIKAEKGLITIYDQEKLRLKRLKSDYKALVLAQGGETMATRKLRRESLKLEKQLGRLDKRVKGSTGLMNRLKSGVARLALAFGGLAIVRNIFKIVKDFEQSQADLASVLGVNVDEMKELTDQARELGAATRFTAGEVAGLQKEFAKLGFDQTEIEEMTEATLSLASATGTELSRAAEVTGSTLRGFGLDASETQRVVDVMAKSFSSSSLDMEKFATAMSTVAPVAKTAGLDIEKTTALLGTLTDRGIDASTAGTGLRNVFLELSKQGITFEEAMQKINSASDKNAASLELFGKRGATIGTILSETAGDVANLEAKLNDAGGAAQEMADKQLNTLNGQLDLLKSAWEGFILDLEEGTGAFAGLKDVIGFVARNLTTIIKSITVAASAFATYKLTVLATTVATKAYSAASIAFAGVQALLTGNLKKATAAMRLFNIAVKLNPVGLLITVLGAAVTAYALFSDSADAAAKSQEQFNAAVEEGKKLQEETSKLIDEDVQRKFRQIEVQQQLNKISKEEALEQKKKFIQEEMKAVRELIEAKKDERTAANEANIERVKETKARQGEMSGLTDAINLFTGNAGLAVNQFEMDAVSSTVIQTSGVITGEIEKLEETQRSLQETFDNVWDEMAIDAADFNKTLSEEEKKAADKRIKELKLLMIRLEDLDNEAIINDEQRQIETLKTKFRREIEAIKGNSEVEIALRNELKLKELREIAKIEDDFRKQREADAFKTVQVIGEIEKEQIAQQVKEREDAIEKEFDLLLDQAERTGDIQGFEIDRLKDLINQKYDLLVRALEDERDLILLNEELTAEERELINLKFNNKLGNLNKERENAIVDMYDKLGDATEQGAANLQKIEEDAAEEALDKQKKVLEDRLNALKAFAQKAIEIADAKTDKEIANIDKEIDASKKREEELQAIADKGNLEAEQSVGEEIKRQVELERQKEELEKKKARRQIILQGLDLLGSKIDAGEKDAVTSTLADMTILLGALSALPGFIDGTETTVGAALGKPMLNTGTDDFVIRVDGKEKILNPSLSAKTGGATTTEIVDGFLRDQAYVPDMSELINPKVEELHAPYQSADQIMKGFNDLKKAIEEKPILASLDFDELAKVFTITTEQSGNLYKTHYNLK